MDTYRYRARTEQGDETAGVIEASSLDDAIDRLLARGLREVQVYLLPPRDAPDTLKSSRTSDSIAAASPIVLNSKEAGELSQHVAHVSMSKVPLAAGLRAAAEETIDSHVATALLWIADQIEQGRTLEDTLTNSGRLLPPHIAGLIMAAAQTGSLGEALFELVELQQKTYSLRREIARGYIYPLTVIVLAVVIIVGTGYYVTGMMKVMMDDFGLSLPLGTRVLFSWNETGIWFAGGFVLSIVVLAALYQLLAGAARWCRLLAAVPLFGALWHWTGVAEWCGLLSVLLRHQVSLPDALRWAGRGTRDANVGQVSLRLADGVARGRSLSQMMYATPQLPASIIPMVRWGEKSGELSDSFRLGQEMFAKRARLRAAVLQSVIPPILFVGIGGVVLCAVIAMFAPLIDLISKLS